MATFSAKVVGGRLNLRASCSTSASSLIQIPDKTAINVETVSGHNDWFKTSYGGYTGYVVAKYVQITTNVSTCTVKNAHTVRQTPSTGGTSSFSASVNQTLKIIDTTTAPGWYRVSGIASTLGTGWSQTSNLNISGVPDGSGVTTDIYGYLPPLYTSPEMTSIYCTVPAGITLSLWYESEDNHIFRTVYNNTTCYISIWDINIVDPDTSSLSYGSNGFGVIKYKKRLHDLKYQLGEFKNNFDYAMQAAVKIFQSKNGLSVDGIIGTNTRNKLNSSSAISWSDPDVTNWQSHMDGTVAPKQWFMNDSYWSSNPWPHTTGATETVGSSGNSIAAMAMVLTTFANIMITPAEMAEFTLQNGFRDPAGQQGVVNSFWTNIGNYFDMITYQTSTTSLPTIQSYLANGALVIATVTADPAQTYTANATQLVIYKVDSTGVYVRSPNSNKNPNNPLSYSAWNGASWFRNAYIYYPAFG